MCHRNYMLITNLKVQHVYKGQEHILTRESCGTCTTSVLSWLNNTCYERFIFS
jgi:hypothetical protein